MSIEDNKALVRRYMDEVLRKGGNIDEFVTSDALKQQVARVRATYPGIYQNMVVEDMIAEGDRVVVRISSHAKLEAEYRGIPPTGQDVQTSGVAIYRVADGKLVEHWTYSDMVQQLLDAARQTSRAS